ncbi:MAG: hypothetical protein A2Y34_00110 [Spirochaetes bacterium GWC1_27_15]|nr:MAG: hypothetical protein A2Y34_00110 [Spirochaetes bacterium GWC1_27_15]
MMKKFFIFVFILMGVAIFCEEINQDLYDNVSSSVVLIENSIYIKSDKIQRKELFKKIEEYRKVKILDCWLPVSTGSGFFITNDGYIVTNAHVIPQDKNTISEIKNGAFNYYKEKVFHNIPYSVIKEYELDSVLYLFYDAIEVAKIETRVTVNNKDNIPINLVTFNKDKDLALLKIDDPSLQFDPVKLGDSDSLKVGDKVAAIGYPMQFNINEMFKEIKATFTIGNVSSLRSENWGIQHTASINPGNSGGPLFDENGVVVGINVGYLKEANSIFFSIPVNKLKEFLIKNNFSSLIEKNESYKYKTITVNGVTKKEIGSTVFINASKGKKIFINKKFKGESPLLINDLTDGEQTIRVEDDAQYDEIELIVNKNIVDTFNYTPKFKKIKSKVVINSDPIDANVYINDSLYGKTPLTLDSLDMGEYNIKIEKDSYFSYQSKININKKEMDDLNFILIKGFAVNFNPKLPKLTVITAKGDDTTVDYYVSKKFLLKNGLWKLTIKNDNFIKETIDVNIENSDVTVDFNPKFLKSKIILNNLSVGSKIYIDNEEFIDLKNNIIEIEIGNHKIEIKKDDYFSIVKNVKLEKDKVEIIDLVYKKSYEKFLNSYKPAGLFFSVSGGIILSVGLPLFLYSIINYYYSGIDNLSMSSDYSTYSTKKDLHTGLFIAGTTVGGIGLCFISISIPLYIAKKKDSQKQQQNDKGSAAKVKISFDINYNNNLDFGFTVKL